ncbi:MAG: thioredoxin [Sporomusaceae bacterium]|nr:thioredoxin [Sporomusaceae bacterium]
MATVIQGTIDNFQSEVLEEQKPVVVDFWAPWCGYCSRLSPVLDDVAVEMSQECKIVKVNVDEQRELAERYAVKSLPTMIVFKQGDAGEKIMGYMPKENLIGKLKPLL